MSEDLFQSPTQPSAEADNVPSHAPLSARMRPRTLDEYAGQRHILGAGKLLRRAVESDRFSSLIFYGPPGVGKTTLAHIISHETKSRFVTLSGVESNVSDIRKEAEAAATLLRVNGQTTILFVDEIHRFNKAQQDVLLPHLERGTLRFIGATTHNPFFYVNSPLVSRSQVFTLEPLGMDDLEGLMDRAISDQDRGFGFRKIELTPDARHHLATIADGDARKCLNALELAVLSTAPQPDGRIVIDLNIAEESVQQKTIVYDGDGDGHYDTASAFIKSMRASDPDAAVYWLAKMIYAGEDIRFIARRIVIAASEDVGLADSNALRVAVAAQQAVEFIGMPEARIILSHATLYVATAPKSNRAYLAIDAALEDLKQGRTLPVPKHLRDAHYAGAKSFGHGEGYLYPHDFEDGFVPQRCLEGGKIYYEPTANGLEGRIKERLEHLRCKWQEAAGAHNSQT
ncbi:MAG: replication-associated recombination protein A [Verrucomicrobiales bacterium]|nr:replication-associated recombination protein A [Verrucomicrobiales bacterium]MCP5556864.1 replication-associated recombination protein A [Verrucomicrobiaceae bacterium]